MTQVQPESQVGSLADNEALPAGTETILLVDDEYELRAVGVGVLDGAGYQVSRHSSGEEAL